LKIPENAKKMFSGILFDIYQWDQEMFDGSTAPFEMVSRTPSTDVIAIVGDKIMILKQEQPTKPLFPSLPGGRVEKGDMPLETAKRELLEETGYESSKWGLLGEWFGVSKLYFHESVFIAKDCKKVAEQNLDSGEKIEVTFVDFDDFLQLCRNEQFTAPIGLKFLMYEALVDETKKRELRDKLFS